MAKLVSTQITGHDLATRKGIFSYSGDLFMVPSAATIRIYSSESGDLERVLRPSNLEHGDEIVQIQLHPVDKKKKVVAFTKFHWLIVFDHGNGMEINSLRLRSGRQELKFGIVFSYKNQKTVEEGNYYVVYYGTVEEPVELSHCRIGDIDSGTELKVRKRKKNGTEEISWQPIGTLLVTKGEDYQVAFGPGGSYIAVTCGNFLKAVRLPAENEDVIQHKVKINKFTCISAHPSEETVATGNDNGMITIWTDFIDNRSPSKSILHWHSSPLADLWFTKTGSFLYSAGREAVLVRWSLQGACERNFLPRTGQSLKYVTGDLRHTRVAVTHIDGRLQLIDSDMNSKLVISSIVKSNLPMKMQWCPNMKAIVMNGHPGQLQFYSPSRDQSIYSLDVCGQNFLADGRTTKVYNVEVRSFATSWNNLWLATYEMRDDGETHVTMRLKFWKYSPTDNSYQLNSTIHNPHQKAVNDMSFSPKGDVCVTTSLDYTFKVWTLQGKSENIANSIEAWECSSVCYRNYVVLPTKVSFSTDGSLISVVFENTITFWDAENLRKVALNEAAQLVHEELDINEDEIVLAAFARGQDGHLFIEVRSRRITVWNLLNLTIEWSVSFEEACILSTIDHEANQIAVFLQGPFRQRAQIYALKGLKNIMDHSLAGDSKALAAMFVVSEYSENNVLVYINNAQELFAVVPEDKVDIGLKIVGELVNSMASQTPFAKLLIAKKQEEMTGKPSSVDSVSHDLNKMDIGRIVDEMFLNVPSHVLPSPEIFCSRFLQAANQKQSSFSVTAADESISTTSERMETESSEAEVVKFSDSSELNEFYAAQISKRDSQCDSEERLRLIDETDLGGFDSETPTDCNVS
ncbi:WD repeat-containing protein 75 [Halotydeus destructor]|nr:WD repeat-containing protein 75 [Halotydeus destructor]